MNQNAGILYEMAEIATTAAPIPEHKNIFPVEAFPARLQEIIKANDKNRNHPADFTGSAMIAAAAAAIGNTFATDIGGRHTAIASVFMLGIAPSSVGKSGPWEFVFAPLLRKDARNAAHYDREYDEYERISNMKQADREKEGITGTPKEPILKNTLIDDFTPEALVKSMKYNPRGLCVYNDEFDQYIKNIGRYTSGGDESQMIKILDGRPVKAERKTGRILRIEKPCVTVTGTIQNSLLKDLCGGNRNSSGFVFRMLAAFPERIVKPYKQDTETTVSPQYAETWAAVIEYFFGFEVEIDTETFAPIPRPLYVSAEADKIHTAWYNRNVDAINDEPNDSIRSICGKLDVMVYRLAMILQLLNNACNEGGNTCIEAKAMTGAVKLIEYYRVCAYKVQQVIINTEIVTDMPEGFQKFYSALPDTFTTGQALALAKDLNIPNRTAERWIGYKEYFKKGLKRGDYAKIV